MDACARAGHGFLEAMDKYVEPVRLRPGRVLMLQLREAT